MKKTLMIHLTDEELLDLWRVIIDHDAEGAMAFMERHVKREAHRLIEGR